MSDDDSGAFDFQALIKKQKAEAQKTANAVSKAPAPAAKPMPKPVTPMGKKTIGNPFGNQAESPKAAAQPKP